ncbi:hypothetical protein BJV74DRAFT_797194 [Russula compacta]|nr:hypothetical protein BJV74DRAFT_797194 [Russula compacta]
MVDFRDPAVIAQDTLVVVKFWHTVAGLYFWEFVTTLDYEWSVIRGHRPYRWSIWVYSVTRAATLAAVILSILSLDISPPYKCQVSSFVAIAAASLLIVLRMCSRGEWSIPYMLPARGLSHPQLRSVWAVGQNTCVLVNVKKSALNLTYIFGLVTDIVLLFIMLAGLLRLRRQGGGSFALTRLLWKQGLIWLLLATIAEVPTVVFLIVNLNAPMPLNVMFQVPALITMSIGATRMHRSLVDLASRPIKMCNAQMPTGSNIALNPKKTAAVPVRFKRMRVAVHTAREQHSPSQTSRPSFCIDNGADGPRPDKLEELTLEYNLERGVEK